METDSPRPERARSEVRLIAASVALAVLMALPHPAVGSPEPSGRNALLGEFNAICFDLTLARSSLARGEMQDGDFADRILDLFVRADSLAALISADAARTRGDMGGFAIQRGVMYLIDSLRENYLGIEERNGVSFLEADQALKAAVAWRADAVPAVSPH